MAKKNSLQADTAYAAIRDKILSYVLPPGAVLSENQLAAELGMSRAPVREAVLMLQADGLVEQNETGKSAVSPIGLSDIVDILQVRRALEVEAVRVIAGNGWLSEEQLLALSDIHGRFCAAADADSVMENYRLDDAFHAAIIEYSKNRRIADIVRRMALQMQRARWLNVADPSRKQASKEEHEAIFRAIGARDLAGCVLAIEAHLNNSSDAFHKVFHDPGLKQIMAGIYNFYR